MMIGLMGMRRGGYRRNCCEGVMVVMKHYENDKALIEDSGLCTQGGGELCTYPSFLLGAAAWFFQEHPSRFRRAHYALRLKSTRTFVRHLFLTSNLMILPLLQAPFLVSERILGPHR